MICQSCLQDHLILWYFSNLQAKTNILSDGEVGKQRITLKHNAIVAQCRGQQRDVAPVLRQLPGSLDFEPGNDAQERGFATAGRAQKADEFTLANFEINVLQSREAAKFLADMAQR